MDLLILYSLLVHLNVNSYLGCDEPSSIAKPYIINVSIDRVQSFQFQITFNNCKNRGIRFSKAKENSTLKLLGLIASSARCYHCCSLLVDHGLKSLLGLADFALVVVASIVRADASPWFTLTWNDKSRTRDQALM